MCRLLRIALLAALAYALTACNIRTNNATNTPYPTPDVPRVRFVTPENLATVLEGTDLNIQLAAEDSGSGVAHVQLLVDDLPHQDAKPEVSVAVPIFTAAMDWVAEGIGKHSMTAIAYRADGTSSAPTVIVIEVLPRS